MGLWGFDGMWICLSWIGLGWVMLFGLGYVTGLGFGASVYSVHGIGIAGGEGFERFGLGGMRHTVGLYVHI